MTDDQARRILVIEDNADLALGLRVNFEEHHYAVQTCRTIADGQTRLRQFQPDLVVLDLSLPDGDGLEFVRRLRALGDETLILILTARSQQDAKVLGLRRGADDYVTKPFDLDELLARVAVLLRRAPAMSDPSSQPGLGDRLAVNDIDIDLPARLVTRAGKQVAVSRIGFDLLVALARRRGLVVKRAELMREVWGYGEGVTSRTLDTHIFALRRELEPEREREPEPGQVRIRTVWGIGYRLD